MAKRQWREILWKINGIFMLKRQVLMFKNVFNATIWDNFQVFFFFSLPFLQVNKHHQTKFLIYQIGIYLVWHMHETKTSQSHSQTQILTKANIISKKPFLYIILYSFVFSFIASFRPRNIMKHNEAMKDDIITTMSTACGASIFVCELF